MVEMQVELFTSSGCINCRKLKKILPRLLSEHGARIESVVERDVGDAAVLADLMMLNADTIPTLRIGDSIITGEEATDELKLTVFLRKNLK